MSSLDRTARRGRHAARLQDAEYRGRRNNPACEANITALVAAWQDAGRPVVFVRHDSEEPGSPLAPGAPGNALRPELDSEPPDLLVTKHVNSSFHGTPDLEAWLRDRGLDAIAVAGSPPTTAARRPRASAGTSASTSRSCSTRRTRSTARARTGPC